MAVLKPLTKFILISAILLGMAVRLSAIEFNVTGFDSEQSKAENLHIWVDRYDGDFLERNTKISQDTIKFLADGGNFKMAVFNYEVPQGTSSIAVYGYYGEQIEDERLSEKPIRMLKYKVIDLNDPNAISSRITIKSTSNPTNFGYIVAELKTMDSHKTHYPVIARFFKNNFTNDEYQEFILGEFRLKVREISGDFETSNELVEFVDNGLNWTIGQQLGVYRKFLNEHPQDIVAATTFLEHLEQKSDGLSPESIEGMRDFLSRFQKIQIQRCDEAYSVFFNGHKNQTNCKDNASLNNHELMIYEEYLYCIANKYKPNASPLTRLSATYKDDTKHLKTGLEDYLDRVKRFINKDGCRKQLKEFVGYNCKSDIAKFYTYFSYISNGVKFGSATIDPRSCRLVQG